MVPYERRKILLSQLEKNEIVTLGEFSNVLENISESTIRRDLKTLESEGEIVLLRGGAAKLRDDSYDTPVKAKSLLNVEQKERIAKKASSFVEDGDVVYLDSGSTALAMVKYIKNKKITLVTSNAMIFSELQDSELECIIVGGKISNATGSILGGYTNNMLENMFFDKAFIGASGFSAQAGINTPNAQEAEKKKIIKRNAKNTYVLADSSKSDKTTMCKVFDLNEVTTISDCETDTLLLGGNYIIAEK